MRNLLRRHHASPRLASRVGAIVRNANGQAQRALFRARRDGRERRPVARGEQARDLRRERRHDAVRCAPDARHRAQGVREREVHRERAEAAWEEHGGHVREQRGPLRGRQRGHAVRRVVEHDLRVAQVQRAERRVEERRADEGREARCAPEERGQHAGERGICGAMRGQGARLKEVVQWSAAVRIWT